MFDSTSISQFVISSSEHGGGNNIIKTYRIFELTLTEKEKNEK